MAKAKVAWRFQYIGEGPVSTGLEIVGRKSGDDDGVLQPNDEVVVGDVEEAVWLRSLSNFREVSSPTKDKPTHRKKKAPAKKPAAKPKPKASS